MDPSTNAYINKDPATTAHIEPTALKAGDIGSDGIPTLAVNSPSTPASTGTSAPSTAKSTSSSTTPAATGLRQRVNSLGDQVQHATDHPAVKNAKGTAQHQIGVLREQLGRSQTIRDLEKRLNVDRVILVFGGVLLYIILIPMNLFGLALPATTFLTLVPASFLAMGVLDGVSNDQASEAATRSLLAYFVTLGFIQFLESLAAGLLEKRIPQYYTVKLLFLAYLLHPRTQGAMKVHQNLFRPLLSRAQETVSHVNTPPQSKEAGFNASSPVTKSPVAPVSHTGPNELGDDHGNVPKSAAQGEGFSVVSEVN